MDMNLAKSYCLVSLVGFGHAPFFSTRSRILQKFDKGCAVIGPNMPLSNGLPVYTERYRRKFLDQIIRFAFPFSEVPQTFCSMANRDCAFSSGIGNAEDKKKSCRLGNGTRACRDKRPGSILVIWRPGVGDDWFEGYFSRCLYLYRFEIDGTDSEMASVIVRIIETHIAFAKNFIRHEIQEKSTRSPLLLPPRNFEPKHLQELFENFRNNYPVGEEQINEFRNAWYKKSYHRPKGRRRGGFVDQREIGFSKDQMLHFRNVYNPLNRFEWHIDLLDAFYRFGVPYEVGLHYDVARKSGKISRPLNASFWNRTTRKQERRMETHINIAPDDAIRK